MSILIKNVNLILEDRIVNNGSVIFSETEEKIKKVASYPLAAKKMTVIDGQNGYLSPGMIDIHIHGGRGFDIMEAELEAVNQISDMLAEHGVTAFLPTTMTMEKEKIKAALENIREAKARGTTGAQVLGAHVEGPFISTDYSGAQNTENIIEAKINLLRDYLKDYYDLIEIVTLAPELKGALKLIAELQQNNIIASAGHSAASYEDFQKAYQLGMDHFTHLYNGMSGFHHRQPGLVGAAFDSEATVELITDFIHHHQAVDRFTIKIKGIDNVILVSDAMEAAGLNDGKYELGGQQVIVKEGTARLESGVLAGSILTLDQAVRNLLEITELTLAEVLRMVTINPAKRLKLDHKLGRLKKGYQADLVLFNQELKVERTFIKGKEI